ncbi:mechanosensitive ion channel family protein [Sphingomonas sp. KC8]|uniref:mechanosensitive ion channel family protein n=1 Tax=Sphingomonas sp. KC8 TaxID=1030157 RepID=UPI0002488676|nr:mechanosensitive ion channel domain-containing protein [Sphingomonas sp. KC8]ARS29210.1 mechanosensitive ion channel protein MscS [Sphingomonas sp. KC8]
MTNSSSETTPSPAAKAPSVDQIEQFWHDSLAWISNHSLQIMIGAAMAALVVVLLLSLKSFGRRLTSDRANRAHWSFIVGHALGRTRIWFMIAIAAELVATYANAPGFVARITQIAFTVAVILQAAVWARVLILGTIEHRAAGLEEQGGLSSAMGIIRLLVTIAVFAIALIVILDNLGVNVTGLVAGLGIGGIAIGLAAQGIFSDLFAALSILFDKPFQRGDGIKFDQTTGSVEAIGLKSTRIRSATGEEVVISNANLLNKELRNYNRLEHRRMVHRFGVTYQTSPDVLARIPDIVRACVEAEPKCVLVRCVMAAFAASSLDFDFLFDVHAHDVEDALAANHRVLIGVVQAFNREGIEFAYPTQTSFTAAPDGTFVLPYADKPDADGQD